MPPAGQGGRHLTIISILRGNYQDNARLVLIISCDVDCQYRLATPNGQYLPLYRLAAVEKWPPLLL